ncbi:Cytochrome c1 transmembrane anchor C-terminal, partial [Penicillium expansum]
SESRFSSVAGSQSEQGGNHQCQVSSTSTSTSSTSLLYHPPLLSPPTPLALWRYSTHSQSNSIAWVKLRHAGTFDSARVQPGHRPPVPREVHACLFHRRRRRGRQLPFYLTLTAALATAAAAGSTAWYYHLYGQEAFAMTPAEEGLHATQYPWVHERFNKTFDHAALRRGFQVYREVCASCHSLTRVPWRSMVGTMHTVDEMKAFAEENEYDTEPNNEGNIEKRPGKLSDYIPAPYPNEEAARAANGGALPPDLSLITKGRHGGCNYIFNLLTGYPDEPPAGAAVAEGMNFNPYFPGTGIAMGRVLFDGVVEYEDGTPATTSQMAKDVVEFLNWSAEPEMDERKKMGVKSVVLLTGLFAISVWVKRYKWAPLKTRKVVYSPPIAPAVKCCSKAFF